MNTTSLKIKTGSLRVLGGAKFVYLILFLVYGHAIFYPLLDYYMPSVGGKPLTFSIAFLLAMGCYLIGLYCLQKRKIFGGFPVVLLIFFFLNGILSLINMYLYFGTVDFQQFAIGFYRCILPATLMIIAYLAFQNLHEIYQLIKVITFASLIIGIAGIVTYLLGERWLAYLMQFRIQQPLHFGGVLRMTSVLWNELTFGIYMALSGILAWNIIFISSAIRERLIGYLLFGISAIGTFASFTRTAWVVLLSGCIASFPLENKMVVRNLFRILVASVIFIGTIFNIPLPTGRFTRVLEAITGHIEALFTYEDPRLNDFKVNLERIASLPTGYGLGTAGYSALPTRETESVAAFKDYVAADNNYLSMILQVGIQGLLMFLLIQGLVLRQIIISYKNCDGQARVILGTAVGWIVGMMIGALFLNVWEYNLVPYIVFTLMGAALRITRMHR